MPSALRSPRPSAARPSSKYWIRLPRRPRAVMSSCLSEVRGSHSPKPPKVPWSGPRPGVDQVCPGNEQQVSGAARILVRDDQIVLTGQHCQPVQARPAERAGYFATHWALHANFSGRRYAAWQVTCDYPQISPRSDAWPDRHPSMRQTLAINRAGLRPLHPYAAYVRSLASLQAASPPSARRWSCRQHGHDAEHGCIHAGLARRPVLLQRV
jgi:hypothetical protein